jgi:hypothetical protein
LASGTLPPTEKTKRPIHLADNIDFVQRFVNRFAIHLLKGEHPRKDNHNRAQVYLEQEATCLILEQDAGEQPF